MTGLSTAILITTTTTRLFKHPQTSSQPRIIKAWQPFKTMTTSSGSKRRQNNNQKRPGYEDNHTVFGRILRGDLPAHVVYEDDQLLVFDDISPASTYHWLVIPKRPIAQPSALTPDDGPLLDHMIKVANELVVKYKANDKSTNSGNSHNENNTNEDNIEQTMMHDVSMGYHLFPFISVYHLHMHVIFPMPAQSIWHRFLFPLGHGMLYKPPQYVKEKYCGGAKSAEPNSKL